MKLAKSVRTLPFSILACLSPGLNDRTIRLGSNMISSNDIMELSSSSSSSSSSSPSRPSRKSSTMTTTTTSETDAESSPSTSSTFDDDEHETEEERTQSVDRSSSQLYHRQDVTSTPPASPQRSQPKNINTCRHKMCSSTATERQPPSPLATATEQFGSSSSASATQQPQCLDSHRRLQGATPTQGPAQPCINTNQTALHTGRRHLRRRQRRTRRKNVTFTTLTIHHHLPTLADNPAVSDVRGPPIGLSWSSTHTTTHQVDEYEYHRQMAGNERRTTQQLKVSVEKRRVLLLQVGHTEQEMDDMMQEVRKIQSHRAKSMPNSNYNGSLSAQLASMDISGKTKRVRNVGVQAKRQVNRVVVAMDRATTIRIQPVGVTRAVLEFAEHE